MSKQLKIEDNVYNDLTKAKWPGETYSHTIARLLDVRDILLNGVGKLDDELAVRLAIQKKRGGL